MIWSPARDRASSLAVQSLSSTRDWRRSHTSVGAAVALGGLLWSTSAAADVSSWLYVGTGPAWLSHAEATDRSWAVQLDTGLGTTPEDPIVVGGLARLWVPLGRGVDLGLLVRTATQGFVLGDWGAAVDLGGYRHWYSPKSTGGQASLALGAPWGIVLSLNGGLGSADSSFFGACIGIDLARLTIYRRTGQSYWPNAFPAVAPDNEASDRGKVPGDVRSP